jgi:hypothetical protein
LALDRTSHVELAREAFAVKLAHDVVGDLETSDRHRFDAVGLPGFARGARKRIQLEIERVPSFELGWSGLELV